MNSDMYDTYSDVDFQYYYPFSFKRQNKDYIENHNKAKFRWSYSDTPYLVFGIQGLETILTLADNPQYKWLSIDSDKKILNIPPESGSWNYISNCDLSKYKAILTIYNFRFEPIYGGVAIDLATKGWYYYINEDDSKEIFKKGNYYAGLVLRKLEPTEYNIWNNIAEVKEGSESFDTITVVNPENCVIYVE